MEIRKKSIWWQNGKNILWIILDIPCHNTICPNGNSRKELNGILKVGEFCGDGLINDIMFKGNKRKNGIQNLNGMLSAVFSFMFPNEIIDIIETDCRNINFHFASFCHLPNCRCTCEMRWSFQKNIKKDICVDEDTLHCL